MKILIADDEPVARQVLREHVEAIPQLEIAGEASTGKETLQRILDLDPDVVLLDQQMPELDGLAVVRSLRGAHTPLIIFVTAYERHALEAFEVGAVDYLLKPVRRERLEKAIEKARRQLKNLAGCPGPKKIVGRRGADLYLLDPAEIVAFQADGELVHIITTGPALSVGSLAEGVGRKTRAPALPPRASRHADQHRPPAQNLPALQPALAAEDVERLRGGGQQASGQRHPRAGALVDDDIIVEA